MRIPFWIILAGMAFVLLAVGQWSHPGPAIGSTVEQVRLPEPRTDSIVSVEKAMHDRRSVREYKDESLALRDVSQLLWAAQGLTDRQGRTAPSAGALYPLDIYVVAGRVDGLAPGVYKYQPAGHSVKKVLDGDRRTELYNATVQQAPVKNAPAAIVISGIYERTTSKYSTGDGDNATGSVYPRGVKYVHFEAGHASQNLYLQAESMGLGTVAIGAFDDAGVKQALNMAQDERPLYIMPVGKVK